MFTRSLAEYAASNAPLLAESSGLLFFYQNAFNASMPHADISQLATCTSCSFSEDLSNYWTANMYFKARNGSYKRVPQRANRYLQGSNGGITVYYVAPYDNSKVTAFKPVRPAPASFPIRNVKTHAERA